MDKQPCVYILSSGKNGTLYIGVTSDLIKRVCEHKSHVVPSFTKRYDVQTLVWDELQDTMESAVRREKNLKKWNRAWKKRLICLKNPDWVDLYPEIL